MKAKSLQKALGMIGTQLNDQQIELTIEFYQLLEAKGDQVTLGDVDRVGREVQSRMQAKQSIVNPMQLNK